MPRIEMVGKSGAGVLKITASDEVPGSVVFEVEGGGSWTLPAIVLEAMVFQVKANAIMAMAGPPPETSRLVIPDLKVGPIPDGPMKQPKRYPR